MLEKVRERGVQDPLLFHKIGLLAGSVAGLLVGLFISDRANEFDMTEIQIEETIDGQQETSAGQAAE